jgi:hypothetical protein
MQTSPSHGKMSTIKLALLTAGAAVAAVGVAFVVYKKFLSDNDSK